MVGVMTSLQFLVFHMPTLGSSCWSSFCHSVSFRRCLRLFTSYTRSERTPQFVSAGYDKSCNPPYTCYLNMQISLLFFLSNLDVARMFFVRFLGAVFASHLSFASNGVNLVVELFENRNAPRALSTIFSNGSWFFSLAYVKIEFFRLPTVRFTHPMTRCLLTGDILNLDHFGFTRGLNIIGHEIQSTL